MITSINVYSLDVIVNNFISYLQDGYRDSSLNRIPQPETVRPVRRNCVLPRNVHFHYG